MPADERQQLRHHLQHKVLLPAREPLAAAVQQARAAELVVEELEGPAPDQGVVVLDELLDDGHEGGHGEQRVHPLQALARPRVRRLEQPPHAALLLVVALFLLLVPLVQRRQPRGGRARDPQHLLDQQQVPALRPRLRLVRSGKSGRAPRQALRDEGQEGQGRLAAPGRRGLVGAASVGGAPSVEAEERGEIQRQCVGVAAVLLGTKRQHRRLRRLRRQLLLAPCRRGPHQQEARPRQRVGQGEHLLQGGRLLREGVQKVDHLPFPSLLRPAMRMVALAGGRRGVGEVVLEQQQELQRGEGRFAEAADEGCVWDLFRVWGWNRGLDRPRWNEACV